LSYGHLVYRALLQGTSLPYPHQQLLSVVGAAVLALVGGLALACFVKAFGTVFLGMPRSAGAAAAIEASPAMRVAMTASAALCVSLGVFPALAVIPIQKVIGSLRAFRGMAPAEAGVWSALGGGGDGSLAPWAVALAVGGVWCGAFLLPRLLGTPVRRYRTWDCGYAHLSPRTQYSATAFVQPLLVIFRRIYRSRVRIQVDRKYLPSRIRCMVSRPAAIDRRLLDLGGRLTVMLSAQVSRLQAGSVHLYLLYIFLTAVALMIFAATR
jgi:hydrogenase-4 component B